MSLIYSFIFRNYFMMVRFTVDLEPFAGEHRRQEYTLDGTSVYHVHTLLHYFE